MFAENNLWSLRKRLGLKTLWVNILESSRLQPIEQQTHPVTHENSTTLANVPPIELHTSPSKLCANYVQSLPSKAPISELLICHCCISGLLPVGGDRHSIDVGTPSCLTPADLPLDGRDFCPGGSPDPSDSSRPKQTERGNLQTCRLNSYLLLNGSEWETLPDSSRAGRKTVLNMWSGKNRGEDVGSLWCVLRGMRRSYHSLSYARMVRWKPLPGTVLGLSLLLYRLNTRMLIPTLTHIAEPILPQRSSNYPQWAGGSQTQGGPTTWVITTTETPCPSSKYAIFSLYLWLIHLWRQEWMEGRVRVMTLEPK